MKDYKLLRGNVSHDEYVQYLHNLIFHYATLDVTVENTQQILSYADALHDALKANTDGEESCIDSLSTSLLHHYKQYVQSQAEPVEDTAEEPLDITENTTDDSYSGKFNLGDRVIIHGEEAFDKPEFGTVVLIDDDINQTYYLVQLDNKNKEWNALIHNEGINCKNVWWTTEDTMALAKDFLQLDTWYCSTDYTTHQLGEILPAGSEVRITSLSDEDVYGTPDKELTQRAIVKEVISNDGDTYLVTSVDNHPRKYFKLFKRQEKI